MQKFFKLNDTKVMIN